MTELCANCGHPEGWHNGQGPSCCSGKYLDGYVLHEMPCVCWGYVEPTEEDDE